MQNNMIINLTSTKNTRYLGCFGSSVIRSDLMSYPCAEDISVLKSLSVTTVIDLRSGEETEKNSDPICDCKDFSYYNIPLHENGIMPKNPLLIPDFYFNMASNKTAVGQILKLVISNSGKTVLHCYAGKDRTGIISAVILSVCGYSDEFIAEDYSYSGTALRKIIDDWVASHPEYPLESVMPRPEYILSFLRRIKSEYKSVENYCRACGINDDGIEILARKLGGKNV